MSVGLILSDEQLVALTHRQRPSAQARILQRLGIPFRYHPTDGGLLVSTAAAEAVIAGREVGAQAQSAGELYTVNFDRLRERRGKAAKHATG